MSKARVDFLKLRARSRELVQAALRQTDDVAQRASLLTEMLRSLWPALPLYACRLQVRGSVHVNVQDKEGNLRADWAELLRDLLGEAAPAERSKLGVKLPRSFKLTRYALALADIACADRHWGVLALAVPVKAPANSTASFLPVHAELLAECLLLETLQRNLDALSDEAAAQAWLADAGELAGPVMHSFNNYLNVISLHSAIWESELPEKLQSELIEIRRHGAEVAAVVKQFQQYREPPSQESRPVDLNQLISEIVEDICRSPIESNRGLHIHRIHASSLPAVTGSVADLKRLVTFLLRHAVFFAGSEGNGTVTVQTAAGADRVILRVEDGGPSLPSRSLAQLFEPGIVERAGRCNLELAACKTIVRRLQGSIRGENRSEGGLAITVELPLERE